MRSSFPSSPAGTPPEASPESGLDSGETRDPDLEIEHSRRAVLFALAGAIVTGATLRTSPFGQAFVGGVGHEKEALERRDEELVRIGDEVDKALRGHPHTFEDHRSRVYTLAGAVLRLRSQAGKPATVPMDAVWERVRQLHPGLPTWEVFHQAFDASVSKVLEELKRNPEAPANKIYSYCTWYRQSFGARDADPDCNNVDEHEFHRSRIRYIIRKLSAVEQQSRSDFASRDLMQQLAWHVAADRLLTSDGGDDREWPRVLTPADLAVAHLDEEHFGEAVATQEKILSYERTLFVR